MPATAGMAAAVAGSVPSIGGEVGRAARRRSSRVTKGSSWTSSRLNGSSKPGSVVPPSTTSSPPAPTHSRSASICSAVELRCVGVLPDQAVEGSPGLDAGGQVGDAQADDDRVDALVDVAHRVGDRIEQPSGCSAMTAAVGLYASCELMLHLERLQYLVAADELDVHAAAEEAVCAYSVNCCLAPGRQLGFDAVARLGLSGSADAQLAADGRSVVGDQ